MRILVSGASGFLGRYVLKELALTDHEVILLVRSRESILEINQTYPEFRCYELDYLYGLEKFRLDLDFDVFLNLAWGNLDDFQSLDHLNLELPAQKKLLGWAISMGVKSIVSVGTCLEYSNLHGELSEDSPCESKIPYAMAKNQLKEFLREQSTLSGFDLTWVRLFYFYGPGQQQRTIFGQLANAVDQKHRVFNALTHGFQTLDYMHVDNVAKSLVRILLTRQAHGEVNICSGQPRTLREITNQWIRDLDWDIQISWGSHESREYESHSFWGSSRKLAAINVIWDLDISNDK
jgi:nucleoside-diphosphate-sugar epimerase